MRILVFAVALLAVFFASGCAYINKGAAAAVDGAKFYCENNATALGRETVRQTLSAEAIAEDIEICLGCPGDTESYCLGPAKAKVDDPLS